MIINTVRGPINDRKLEPFQSLDIPIKAMASLPKKMVKISSFILAI